MLASIVDRLAAGYRIVAVEGCDGTGKTTLAGHLAARHGFTVVHSPRTPDHIDLADRYRRILSSPGPLALDRCFASELVYGPLRRTRSRLSWAETFELTDLLVARGGAFVHLTGPALTIRARLLTRDGTAPSLTAIDELVAAYQRIFTVLATRARVIKIGIT